MDIVYLLEGKKNDGVVFRHFIRQGFFVAVPLLDDITVNEMV